MNPVVDRVTVHRVAIPLRFRRFTSDGGSTHTVRTLLKIEDSEGRVGAGLVGPIVGIDRLRALAAGIVGLDPFEINILQARLLGGKFVSLADHVLFAGLEVALLDLQGQILGVGVGDLLGGKVHTTVPISGVLYREPFEDSSEADPSPEPVVRQAEALNQEHGFTIFKFKAGAASVDEDIAVMQALRDRFPSARLRIDPNGSWTVESTLRALPELSALRLDWLEDPTLGRARMSAVTRVSSIPTATNMCITHFGELHDGFNSGAASIVLTDLGYAGGLRRTFAFTEACQALGLGTAVHSGPLNQTGVGFAATLQFASTLPELIHGVDGVEYFNSDDVIEFSFEYKDGYVAVPAGVGLGITINEEKLSQYEEEFRALVRDSESSPSRSPARYPRF